MTNAASRLLIIEDHPLQADLLATALSLEFPGELIERVATGEEAVAVAETFQPHVVISDRNLPGGINGSEAVSRLRSLLPPFKALLLSGSYHKAEGIDQRVFDASLEKPVKLTDLLSMLRSWTQPSTDMNQL